MFKHTSLFIALFVVISAFAAVKKGPYLIWNGDNTAMTVLWQFDATQASSIEWGSTTSYGNTAATVEYGTDHQHQYSITGLTPGAKYYYNVPRVGSGSFLAAPPADARNVTIFDYGDCQDTVVIQAKIQGRIIKDYEANPLCQTLCLRTGDWIMADNEDNWTNLQFNRNYDTLVKFLSEVPLCGSRGNHEGTANVFKKYYPCPYVGGFYWSFDYGPVHVAVVDGYTSFSSGSAQYTWLEHDLDTSSKEWKIIVLHEPGWSAYGRHENNVNVQNYIHPLCTAHGVDLVIAGHNHYYSRAVVNGVTHITSGGGGSILVTPDPSQPNIVTVDKTYHYNRIEIQGGVLTFSAIRSTGTVIESFQIVHSSSAALTAPEAGAELAKDAQTTLSASVIEAGGVCANVSFYANYGSGDVLIGEDNYRPWSISWTPSAPGLTVALTARAEVNMSGSTEYPVSEPVTVTITDPENTPPNAAAGPDITVTDLLGDGTEPVTLADAGSDDPGGYIMAWTWKEGATTLGTGANVTASFTPGLHFVILQVQDEGGKKANDTVMVNVQAFNNQEPAANAGEDQLIVDSDGNGIETVTLDGSGSMDSDGSTVLYEWDVDNNGIFDSVKTFGNPAVTFDVALGADTVILRVTDNNGANTVDTVIVEVIEVGELIVVSAGVGSGENDAEENVSNGAMDVSSSDLELVFDAQLNRTQLVGMRFTGCEIPRNAVIKKAYIQFTCKELPSGATQPTATIHGELAPSPAVYTSTTNNISGRGVTAANVSWIIPAWDIGEALGNERTPDLKNILQEIVTQNDYNGASAIAFVISGGGGPRTAYSYNGSAANAPLLHVEYVYTGPVSTPPVCTITSPAQGALFTSPASFTISARATDADGTISNVAFFMNGLALGQLTSAPYEIALNEMYAGTYAISAIATDNEGKKDTAEVSVTVNPPAGSTVARGVVAMSGDDAEERISNGTVTIISTDLELIRDGANDQTIGVRFTGCGIPQNSVIGRAFIQFTCKDASSAATSVTLRGQAADNGLIFTAGTGNKNISNRSTSSANVAWSIPTWVATGDSGTAQRTSDLSTIVQEIVNRAGYNSASALVFILTGSGTRNASAWDETPAGSKAPRLYIEYSAPLITPPQITADPANQTVDKGETATFSVIASGGALSYQWQKNETDISGANEALYTTPMAVLIDNGALFRCIVSNAAGKDTSIAATLTVEPPAGVFNGPELAGRPTATSITLNVVHNQAMDVYIEYGTEPGVYTNQTGIVSSAADVPNETVISDLTPDTKYYYRVNYRTSGTWISRAEHSFHTQRPAGSNFVFTVTSDTHFDSYMNNQELYETTLNNINNGGSDFHFDCGDAFLVENRTTVAETRALYLSQRPSFGIFSHSTPLFLALGNHENEERWNLNDFSNVANSTPVISANANKYYYLNPIPESGANPFYRGNEDVSISAIDGDGHLEDYYSFEWGDALFVVLDPYWYTGTKPFSGSLGGEEDDETVGDEWDWTLGHDQYEWLKTTLEQSTATYKFIFMHQLTSGTGTNANYRRYGRGGAKAAPYYEWGGLNTNGTDGFAQNRPGWDKPVHDILVENRVSAVFHGHDHVFAMEELDGIVYQEVPQPADDSYSTGFAENQTNYAGGAIYPNSGHIRVEVAPQQATIKYIRAFLPGDGDNGQTAFTYAIAGGNDAPVANAGPDQSVTDVDLSGDESVTLDGSASTDDNNNITSYAWTEGGSGIATGASPAVVFAVGTHVVTLTVTDGGGKSSSDEVEITVKNRPPVITSQPSDVSVVEHTTAGFSVVATGTDLSYQWYRGTDAISGADAATYSFTAVAPDDDARFHCVVANDGGNVTSSTASLTVTLLSPAITADPAAQTVNEGDAVTFTVVATGTAIGYQWQRDGNDITGATSASYMISAVTMADNGALFRCIVSNTAGKDTSAAATLTVTMLVPVVVTDPLSQTVTEGSSATFSVTATGTGISYQWQRDGNDITGATSASYMTPAATMADNGALFRCIVSNAAGKDTSATATLTVTMLVPVVVTDPLSLTVTGGLSATFSVTATGTGISYQWQRDGNDITGASSASYITPAATMADNGALFRCIVSNAAGKDTSAAATLTVTMLVPVVVTDPLSQTVTEGSIATFGVIATGTGISYQWQRDGNDMTGAISASYITPATTMADNGAQFRCIVSNAAGKDTSAAATLTVTMLVPVVVTDPLSLTVTEGLSATFSVTAAGTAISYKWQRDGNDITGASSASYMTSAMTMADNGTLFRCIVSNAAGKDTSAAAILTVTMLPPVVTDPLNQTVTEGATATFSVIATGTGISYQWQRDGNDITGASSASYMTSATTMADNGALFRCIVSNAAGKDTSAAATLTVQKSVKIPLSSGWNMISFNILPVDSAAEAVFGDVEGIVIVKNNAGQIYWPEYGINTIGNLRIGEGYKVYMASDDTLRAYGQIINTASTAIGLESGWNMIAYFPQEAISITTALAGVKSQIDLVKNNAGEIYWPAYGINTIGSMKPFQGYQIHMRSAVSLTYPQ